MKSLTDRLGNAVLATIPRKKSDKPITMSVLYPEKKEEKPQGIYYPPGMDKAVVIM